MLRTRRADAGPGPSSQKENRPHSLLQIPAPTRARRGGWAPAPPHPRFPGRPGKGTLASRGGAGGGHCQHGVSIHSGQAFAEPVLLGV